MSEEQARTTDGPMLHINCGCKACKTAYQRGFDEAMQKCANASRDALAKMQRDTFEQAKEIHIAFHFDTEQHGWSRVAGVYSTLEDAEKRVQELGIGTTQSLRLNEPVRFTFEAKECTCDDLSVRGRNDCPVHIRRG